MRPLKFHSTRHTWASLALQAGRPLPWVSGQLGHATKEFTLEVYGHAVPQEEQDLSIADFSTPAAQTGIASHARP